MGQKKCDACGGTGKVWVAPQGVNPFNCRLPHLADIVEKRNCWHCHGTGDRSYNMQTTDDD